MSAPTFIGRKDELNALKGLLDKKVASLVVIRGRRRIGKSRLAAEFARPYTFYSFAGLAPEPEVTAQSQRNEFGIQLSQQTGLPEIQLDDWSKVFILLANQVKTGRVIILFDEITWMAHGDPTFLSKLKNAWDLHFSKNSKLILILCGSVSAWIEKKIMQSTGFIGRISLELVIQELSLFYCNQLFEALGFHHSVYEKMQYLSLTGCIPWYLEQLNPKQSAENNIRRLCFRPNAVMLQEFKRVFYDLFGRREEIYQKITSALAGKMLDYTTLAKTINYPKSSTFTDYLAELECSGYIAKYHTWKLATGKKSKLFRYRLSDNYLRFYFSFLRSRLDEIEKGRCANIVVESLPGWRSILGLQFENLVLNNRDLILKTLNIHPEETVADDPYFQRTTLQTKGCQIDYLIQTKTKTLYVCEIKFTKNLDASKIIAEMKAKMAALSLPRGFSAVPVLIHFSDDEVTEAMRLYFYKTIYFGDFFKMA
ncbi:MAG: ATP-binding protein [Pseudomonadota bacterium]